VRVGVAFRACLAGTLLGCTGCAGDENAGRSTVVAQAKLVPRLRRQFPAVAARFDVESAGALVSAIPNRADAPIVLTAPGVRLSVRATGATRAEKVLEENVAVYRNAYRATDAVIVSGGKRAEELLYLRDRQSPTTFEYEVVADVGELRANGDVVDRRGFARLRLTHPWAIDADGKRVEADFQIDGTRLAITLDSSGLSYPILLDPSWELTSGPMMQSRYDHALALLGDGRLLACGGTVNGTNGLRSCEFFDPNDGSWTQTPDMVEVRRSPSAATLQNGRVLVCGGGTATCELYDPWQNAWLSAPSLPEARDGATATRLLDGRVLLTGGGGSGIPQVYHPTTNEWTGVGSITPRQSSTATLLASGKVLIVGGMTSSAPVTDVDIFDPTSETWTQGPAMPAPRADHSATRMRNGMVVIAGGTDGTQDLDTALLYDESTGTWTVPRPLTGPRRGHSAALTQSGDVLVVGGRRGATILTSTGLFDGLGFWPAGTMKTGRDGCGVAILASGDVVAVGGLGASGALGSVEAVVERSPWRSARWMAQSRSAHTATRLPDGRVLVAGGSDAAGQTLAAGELYDPAGRTWTTAGSMTHARGNHTATLLENGTVLIAGGYHQSSVPIAETEVFDPSSQTWSDVGSMTQAQAPHTATLLPDGRVLALSITGAEVYDPGSQTWSSVPSMTVGHGYHTASLLSDGKVLVVGGYAPNAEVFDPATESWTVVGSSVFPRISHAAALLDDGRVLVAGGTQNATAELYDPMSQTWSTAGTMAKAHEYGTASLLDNGTVLLAGGRQDEDDWLWAAEIYDPTTGGWTKAPDMANAREFHTATVLEDGSVLVAGGSSTFYEVLASAEIYDPTTDWVEVQSMTEPRRDHTATLLRDGSVLVAGGADTTAGLYSPGAVSWTLVPPMTVAGADTATLLGDGRVLVTKGTTAELYNPSTKSWTLTSPMSESGSGSTASFLRDGTVLIAGGTATAEVYDPESENWNSVEPMSTSRTRHTATLLEDGTVLVAGGHGPPNDYLSTAEVYDPENQSWSSVGVMTEARADHTATRLGNGKVIVAGGIGGLASAMPTITEIYDPATQTWSNAGALAQARMLHTATLSWEGNVVVTGGAVGPSAVSLLNVEVFEPVLGAWRTAESMAMARQSQKAVQFGNGTLLVVGGAMDNGHPFISTAEVWRSHDGIVDSWRPVVYSTVLSPGPGGTITLSGTGFHNAPESTCGTQAGAAANQPVVVLRGLSTNTAWWIAPSAYDGTSITLTVPKTHPYEVSQLRVIVAGVPSEPVLVNVTKGGQGDECAASSECVSGACVNGVCCATSVCGICEDCNVPFSVGRCTALSSFQDDAETCDGENTCNGSGQCLLKNGRACATEGSFCASNNCVDGVCCDGLCTAICMACNLPGSEGECTHSPAGSNDHYPQSSCAPPGACDGQGVCSDERPIGETCATSDECASGYCIDSVCCDTDCATTCWSCIVFGAEGTCTPTPVTQSDAPGCWNGSACDGTSAGAAACKAANGITCVAGGATDCASGFCVDGVCCQSLCDAPCSVCGGAGLCGFVASGLQDDFPVGACTSGDVCDGSGGCMKSLTQPCADPSECLSDFCADGMCCSEACDDLCWNCLSGVCAPVAVGITDTTPNETCGGAQACDGSGTCKSTSGTTCDDGLECISGFCTDNVCCQEPCDGTCLRCTASGACVPVSAGLTDESCPDPQACDGIGSCKSALKTECDDGSECASGYCADSVCCDTACTGQCEACDVPSAIGKCSPVDGIPHGDRPPCEGPDVTDICTARACDGNKNTASCVGFVGSEVDCREPSCAGGVESLGATCEGTGVCPASRTNVCEPYGCGATACKQDCASDADCTEKYQCDVGLRSCEPKNATTCEADGHTVRAADGSAEDCSPYRCSEAGQCLARCSSAADCVAEHRCDAQQHCVTQPVVSAEESGCGCRMTKPAELRWGWAAALFGVFFAVRRVRKRRHFRRSDW
jgi:N-acetylneuraminic acid mutarotase